MPENALPSVRGNARRRMIRPDLARHPPDCGFGGGAMNTLTTASAQESAEPPPPNRRTAVTIMAVFTVLAVAAALFGGGLLSRTATTTDGDFAGETVEVVIPLAEGGGTDTWARFVGPGPDPRASRPAGLRAGQRRRR